MGELQYFRLEFKDRPPSYIRAEDDKIGAWLEGAGASFAVLVDEAEYMRNTTLIDRWIMTGWASGSLEKMITDMYESVFGEKPGQVTAQSQLGDLFDIFDQYREQFGQLDEVRCEKCHNFFGEFGDCLYCEEDEEKRHE